MNRRDWIRASALAGAACMTRQAIADTSTTPSKRSSHGFLNLSINENQFGPSPKAITAMEEALGFAHEYPLNSQARLKAAIARREQVSPEQVILGAGSSDIIMGASAYFGQEGGNMISSDPSFAPLMMWAKKFGVEHVKIPWTSSYEVDLERIESSITDQTKVVYICNPENPVGTVIDPNTLYEFCKRVSQRVPVLIDEAYLDFAGESERLSMNRCVREGMQAIVLRTFSKAYGLGGMRVGYAIAPPQLSKDLAAFYVTGIGCGCSHVSLEAALAAYEDSFYLAKTRQRTQQARNYLCSFLSEKGYGHIPSQTTFVLTPVATDSQKLADAIFGGFNIKISPRKYYDQDFLRISVGTMSQMKRLTEALDFVL